MQQGICHWRAVAIFAAFWTSAAAGDVKAEKRQQVVIEVLSGNLTSKGVGSPVALWKTSRPLHIESGALWVRGSSSKFHPKKPYRLELQDDSGQDTKASLLDMPEESDWMLIPSYLDKTLLRDVLAHDMWRDMGHYSPRCRFVELFIVTNSLKGNEGHEAPDEPSETQNPQWANGPEFDVRLPEGVGWEHYQGVYILVEKIKRGKERLNIKKLKKGDSTEPAVTGGYIFKKDRLNADEKGIKTTLGTEFAFEEPKERDITPVQSVYLTNHLNEWEQVLFSDKFADPEHGYRKYIDVDSFIDYHWIVEVQRNVDGYWFSIFLHKDRGGKLKMGPVWDSDLSFGNAYHQGTYGTEGWRWQFLAKDQFYRWYVRLFEDADFLQRYIDRWAELRINILATSNVLAKIDKYIDEIGQAAIDRNYKRWPTLGTAVQKVKFIGNTYQEEVDWLKTWISRRLAWIDSQDFPPPLIHRTDAESQTTNSLLVAKNAKPSQVTMAWLVGQVYYTLDGSDPRLPGGAVSPKALQYKDPILISPGTHLVARVRSEHALWSAPRSLIAPQ